MEREKETVEGGKPEEEFRILSGIAKDMRQNLLQRRFGSIVPWKSEVIRLLETLQKRTNHNVLLYGPVGVGKRTMVLRLAEQIASGRVPAQLRNLRILEITLPSILPFIQEEGDFEKVFFLAIKEALEEKDVILYFNQLENFLAAGDGALGDATHLLEIATRQLQLRVIASISDRAYQQAAYEQPWINANMVPIQVKEPSQDMARKILRVVRTKLESFHGIEISRDGVDKAIDLSSYYLKSRVLPGKALELLDEACAAEVVRAQKERKARPDPVDAAAVARTVSRRLDIPLEKLHDRSGSELLRLEENLRACVKGQDEVLRKVADVIRVAKLGLSCCPDRPDGVFLFVGPSGVGKNQLASRLAVELFGGEEHMLLLDMAQFTGDEAPQKLLGSRAAPGMKGVLTEMIERRPNAVFVVDGVEKANPKVGPILLQILKYGRIMDETGRQLSFGSTTMVVVANSDNILPDEVERTVGFTESGKTRIEVQRKAIESAAKEFFAVDFLNAFDEVLYFDPLTPDSVRDIAAIEIARIQARLEERGVALTVGPEVTGVVAKQGFCSESGAHRLGRAVESLILKPVSVFLLENVSAKKIHLDVRAGRIRAFAKRPRRAPKA